MVNKSLPIEKLRKHVVPFQAGVKHLLFGCERPKSECFNVPRMGTEHALGVFSSHRWTQDRVVFDYAGGAILEDVLCLSKVTLENMDWYFDVVFGEAVDSAGDLVQVLGPTCVVLFRIDASLRAELACVECFEVSNVV